jgi:hypothetical protein
LDLRKVQVKVLRRIIPLNNERLECKSDDFLPTWKLWFAFFLYTALVALIIQLVVLPYILTSWHGGNGLLAGGDWLAFHRDAVILAQKIQANGWSVWELRPNGQGPVGLASAIYTLSLPKPFTLIPINAAIHATSTIILMWIIQVFIENRRKAMWAVFPFFFYPSAALWYSQIHKDGVFIFGSLLYLYGWIVISAVKKWNYNWWHLFSGLLSIVLGALLVWTVRPYGVQMMQGIGAIMGLILTLVILREGLRSQLHIKKVIGGVLVIWVIILLLTPLTRAGIWRDTPTNIASSESPQVTFEVKQSKNQIVFSSSPWTPIVKPPDESTVTQTFFKKIIGFVDNKVYALAAVRNGYRLSYPEAKSSIDLDVGFSNAKDMLLYFPRALQIALFAPFPNQWFSEGSQAANTTMRRVSMIEMLGIYASLVFLPFAIWSWRRRIELWLLILFTVCMMSVFAMVVPNIGSLYRVRYGFIMTLVALAIAGGLNSYPAFVTRFKKEKI